MVLEIKAKIMHVRKIFRRLKCRNIFSIQVHVPSIYCHRLVLGKNYRKPIERLRYRLEGGAATTSSPSAATGTAADLSPASRSSVREIIARRAALEFQDGMYGA